MMQTSKMNVAAHSGFIQAVFLFLFLMSGAQQLVSSEPSPSHTAGHIDGAVPVARAGTASPSVVAAVNLLKKTENEIADAIEIAKEGEPKKSGYHQHVLDGIKKIRLEKWEQLLRTENRFQIVQASISGGDGKDHVSKLTLHDHDTINGIPAALVREGGDEGTPGQIGDSSGAHIPFASKRVGGHFVNTKLTDSVESGSSSASSSSEEDLNPSFQGIDSHSKESHESVESSSESSEEKNRPPVHGNEKPHPRRHHRRLFQKRGKPTHSEAHPKWNTSMSEVPEGNSKGISSSESESKSKSSEEQSSSASSDSSSSESREDMMRPSKKVHLNSIFDEVHLSDAKFLGRGQTALEHRADPLNQHSYAKLTAEQLSNKFHHLKDGLRKRVQNISPFCPNLNERAVILHWSNLFKEGWTNHTLVSSGKAAAYSNDLSLQLVICLANQLKQRFGAESTGHVSPATQAGGKSSTNPANDELADDFSKNFHVRYIDPLVEYFEKLPQIIRNVNSKGMKK